MKKITLFLTIFFVALIAGAQNVAINNDGTSAAASAMLDVKSTTKGMLTPRMTSAQRTAIASPALGLLVFDTDTKTLWAYDGASWKNLYTSGGGLILPFSQAVNTGTSALQITNSGAGAAIEGNSSAQFGTGMVAKATGEGGWGLYAYTNGVGSKSVNAFAQNGTAFYGENNAVSTNTLMSLVNFGSAKTATFQLSNAGSTDANVQIAGNHLGNQLKIYQTNAANANAAVSIENSGTGTGLDATSTSGYAIRGVTNTATGFAGVYGQNNGTAGSGVIGKSDAANTQGVYGLSINGIGVRAASTSGTALSVEGNLKIAGGNTNPGAGKVLTSDANGNATWQQAGTIKCAFKAFEINTAFDDIVPGNWEKVIFSNENYDITNNFSVYTGATPDANASVFTAPANGIYHFDALLNMFIQNDLAATAGIRLMVTQSGSTSELQNRLPVLQTRDDIIKGTYADLSVSGDYYLVQGAKVWIEIRNDNTSNAHGALFGDFKYSFNGHLAVPL